MNKFRLVYLITALFITGICNAQNTWQATNNFHSLKICLQSKDTIYSCSAGGGIAKSVDAGNTWSYPTNQVSAFVKEVSMATNTIGYYYTYENNCGDITCKTSNIYKTTDAGCSWTKINSPAANGNTEYITALSFFDANTGWCSTNTGNVFKTINGGTSWTSQLTAGLVLFTVKCYNSQLVIATGNNGKVFTSTNGGASWITNTIASGWYLLGLSFADNNNIYITGQDIYKSSDGGITWQSNFSVPPGANGFVDVAFRDANYGIAISSGGLVFKTTDGGNSWLQITNDALPITNIAIKNGTEIASAAGTILKNEPTQNTYWKVIANGSMTIVTRLRYSHDGTTAFTDGRLSGRLQKSSDYGKNWKSTNLENTSYGVFYAISKDDAGNGIAVGRFGLVYNTLNNGQDWKYQLNNYPLPVQNNDLTDVQLNNSGNAWAVGQNGTIIHSASKGVNWQIQNGNTVKDLSAVSFSDDNLGFVSGVTNILKTTNGGASWQSVLNDINRSFKEVKCISPTVVYAISNSTGGTDTTFLLKSVDGGSTWKRTLTIAYPYSYFTFAPLQGISVISPGELRAYTTDSIYYSSNGGASWQSSYFGKPIGKIKFLNSSQGYLLSGQSVFYTSNAGLNWNVYTPIDGIGLYGIDVKPGKVTVSGTGASVLYNENNLATNDDWHFQLQAREFSDGNGVFDFIDSLHGWKFHLINRAIAYTANGGKSWKVNSIISTSIDTTLSDLYFSSLNNGYATDNHGNFLKTTDNGKNWKYIKAGSGTETLNSINFYDDNYGFFAGSNGLFVTTTDGCTNFTVGHLPSGENIGKVICTNKKTAWLNTATKIYFTNDNGASWISRSLPGSTPVNDIAFINDSTGWVLSYAGGVPVTYATTNYGASFTPIAIVGSVIPFGLSVPNLVFNKLKQGIALSDGVAVGQGYLYILPSVIDTLNADFIIDTLNFCSRQIKLTATSGTPLSSVTWKIGGQTYTGNPVTVTLPLTPDTVTVSLYAAAQSPGTCSQVINLADTITKIIRFDTLPIAKFQYDSACNNTIFSFKNQSLQVPVPEKYWWNFGDGASGTQKNPAHTYATTGSYTVNLVSYSKNGCPSDTAAKIIQTGRYVPLPISKTNDIDCANTFARLNVPPGFSYDWTPKNYITNPLVYNPLVNPENTQLFIVTIKDTSGCVVTDSITVFVHKNGAANIFVANAFTPNGDNINDCIGAKTSGTFEYFEFAIYNRWGERVFSTRNPYNCWDGRYKGKLQPASNFVYYIRAKNGCGEFEKKGNILLLQ